jgi:Domain of unknown function (DUF4136)
MPMTRSLCVLAAAAALSGCAAMNSLSSDVSSHGQWPAERRASMSFVFERLPSQQEQPERQALLEDAARPALEAAGFRPAADPAAADYSVELGARVSGDDRVYLSEGFGPWGWHGFYRRSRFGLGLGHGPYWGGGWATPVYEREVLVLIRDRRSGRTVYETRASNQGSSSAINALLPAMFAAALKDFPSAGMNPRRVVTQIDKR